MEEATQSGSALGRRDAHTARVVLRMIGSRRHTSTATARDRVMTMMADLDVVLLYLPDDPPDDMIHDIERVVTTLRTADQCFSEDNSRSGMQALELAQGRLVRLAELLFPAEDPDENEPVE